MNQSELDSNSLKLDRSQILTPRVSFSDIAFEQLKLIMDNEFTLGSKYFRILISGKGCDGFTYSTGFTEILDEDFEIQIQDRDTTVVMDSFAAFYLQDCLVSYQQDFENDSEGFVVTNLNQEKFKGKFWRAKEDEIPPVLTK